MYNIYGVFFIFIITISYPTDARAYIYWNVLLGHAYSPIGSQT